MKCLVRWFVILLLVGAAGWFGWRRFGTTPPPVDLTKHDGQTIDFSSGQPVVKDAAEDRAALEQAAREMAEAARSVTFEAPKKKAGLTPTPPAK